MEHLSNGSKNHTIQHKNSHKLCDEKEHPFLFWSKINRNRDVNMIRIAQSRESQEQILGSEEINPREQKFECRSLESK